MKDHRVRLDDSELALAAAALRARAAGVGVGTAMRCLALAQRLEECGPGNPYYRFTRDLRSGSRGYRRDPSRSLSPR